MRVRILLLAAGLTVAAGSTTSSQLRVTTVTDQSGEAALGLALQRLSSVGTFMMTTAHPDDENNGLLAMMRYRYGLRTVLVTATRGDGGQNEIGPELFDALAVLRTEELLAAHRFDGAEQYFTRAVDFGYSFSVEETLERWGDREILGDFVRHIRALRPDLVAGFLYDGEGGGQHHQTSTRLALEAFRLAADPTAYPEQLREGLRPWQAKKFYHTVGFGFGRRSAPQPGDDTLIVDTNVYDPLLGRTYDEIGAEARSMHKCQGMSQLLPLPNATGGRAYKLIAAVDPAWLSAPEGSMLDGLDTSLEALAGFAGDDPPAALRAAVSSLAGHVTDARAAFAASHDRGAVVRPLVAGLAAARELRRELSSLPIDDTARYEIDFRLQRKEREFEDALILAAGVEVEALASDGLVLAGQPLTVTGIVAGREAAVEVRYVELEGFESAGDPCGPGRAEPAQAYACEARVAIPAQAQETDLYFSRLRDFDRYAFEDDAPFGLPYRPTPFVARFALSIAGAEVRRAVPVQHRYERSLFDGEKRMDVTVVPAFSVSVTPGVVVVPRRGAEGTPTSVQGAAAAPARDVRVTIVNGHPGPASGEVFLEVPAGWTSTPSAVPVSFTREDEAFTVRFSLSPPSPATEGDVELRAVLRAGDARYDRGYQVVEYPHTTRRHLVHDAVAEISVMDVQVAPDLLVGYVMGVGDAVPEALEQLGATVALVDPAELAWGDLSRYDVIVTGVRAYERRDDLRAYNQRLLDYVERGGTMIVQYNKVEFNDAQFGPYPARVGRDRVADEGAPVRLLAPDHPVFTWPNRLTPATWQGWVQERGLYFLGERDARYVDLVEAEDPFPYNAGPKRGALVEARYGSGRWVYVGLGLWRQLPAGTRGAYELMANLVSLGRSAGESQVQPD